MKSIKKSPVKKSALPRNPNSLKTNKAARGEFEEFKSNVSALMSRRAQAQKMGKSFGGKRDLYETLGYPDELGYEDYFGMYDREGIAARIVDTISDETWRKKPILFEGDKKKVQENDKPSEQQEEFSALADKHDLWTAFNDVDAACGCSRFGLILLGLDGKLEDEVEAGSQLLYVAVHDEGSATINRSDIQWATDSERYGLPEYYQITIDDELMTSKRVHWSRVIHVKEGRTKSRIYGKPRLKTMYNRLMDLEKVIGGGSEAFWLLIYRGLAFQAREGYDLPAVDTPEYRTMQDEIDEYVHSLRRYMRLQGVEVKDMGGAPVDSDAQFKTIIAYLAGSSRIPQRILIGSEAGQLASSQDEFNLSNFISSRQENFAEPRILREFISRGKQIGFLKYVPETYGVFWRSLFQLTDGEKAAVAATVASAINTASGGAPETVMSPQAFASRYLDYEEEVPDPVEVLQPTDLTGLDHFEPQGDGGSIEETLAALAKAMLEKTPSDNFAGLVDGVGYSPFPSVASPVDGVLRALRSTVTMNASSSLVYFPGGDGAVKMVHHDDTLINNSDYSEYAGMVCLRVPDVIKETFVKEWGINSDGEIYDTMHITLLFIGDTRTIDMSLAEEAVRAATSFLKPIKGKVSGVGRFVNSSGDEDAIVALFDSPDIGQIHDALVAEFDNKGVPFHNDHGFTPHITLEYVTKGHDTPAYVSEIETVEINFDAVYLVSGTEWKRIELSHGH